MSEASPKSIQSLRDQISKQSLGVLLPPLSLRAGKQENETRQVIRKDLEEYGGNFCPVPGTQGPAAPVPTQPVGNWKGVPYRLDFPADAPGQATGSAQGNGGWKGPPWKLNEPANSPAGGLVGSQTPLPHQNTLLSNQGSASDRSHVETQGDPKTVAKEAEPRSANTLIKQVDDLSPKLEFKSEGRTEEFKEGKTERTRGGAPESSSKTSNTYKEKGRTFDGKYTMGGSVKGPWKDKDAFKSGADNDGLAQGKYDFGYYDYETSAGAGVTSGWGDGKDTNIFAEAGGKAEVGLLRTEGTLNKDGLASVGAKAKALSAKAEAKAGLKIGTYEGSPTATVEGKIGAEAILGEVEGNATISVTPRRAFNPFIHAFNGVAKWAEWDTRLDELDESWDWGFFVEGNAAANVGAGIGAEGSAGKLDNGKWGVRAKAKGSVGVGGKLGIGLGIRTPGTKAAAPGS